MVIGKYCKKIHSTCCVVGRPTHDANVKRAQELAKKIHAKSLAPPVNAIQSKAIEQNASQENGSSDESHQGYDGIDITIDGDDADVTNDLDDSGHSNVKRDSADAVSRDNVKSDKWLEIS